MFEFLLPERVIPDYLDRSDLHRYLRARETKTPPSRGEFEPGQVDGLTSISRPTMIENQAEHFIAHAT